MSQWYLSYNVKQMGPIETVFEDGSKQGSVPGALENLIGGNR